MPQHDPKPVRFTLMESPRSDPLANMRHEYKFVYRNCDPRKIETILEVNNKPVFHAGKESLVNSIYFDTPDLISFHENLGGISKRFKLRLRWYDAELPRTLCFFEVKRRINRVIAKERYPIALSRPLHVMNLKQLVAGLIQVLPETPGHLLRLRPEPVVLVRYRRRHFVVRDVRQQIRLTVDRDIIAVGQLGAPNLRMRMPLRLDGRVILEIKTNIGKERHIPRLLRPLRPRLSRFSKYVMCCALTEGAVGIHTPLVRQK